MLAGAQIRVSSEQRGQAFRNNSRADLHFFPVMQTSSGGAARPRGSACGRLQFNPGHINKSNEQVWGFHVGTERCKHVDLRCF